MKCQTENCQNESIKWGHFCAKCRKRKYREKYPLKYIYDTVKMNAKRRGKEFTLTFGEFKEFCVKTGYDEKKGKSSDSLSIDRRNPSNGYSKDNIRAITLSDNSKFRNDPEYKVKEIYPF
jgi:hypothetical protein